MRLGALTREIAAVHPEALPLGAGAVVLRGTRRATAGGLIVELGRPGAPVCTILKLASTGAGRRQLERETAILAALHADERLADWRELLPRPIAHGILHGRSYRLDEALAGVPVPTSKKSPDPRVLAAAASAIAVLHAKTRVRVVGGPDLAERWVDAPLRELTRRGDRSRRRRYCLDLLRDELHGAVTAGTFTGSWIHGDYWLGNLLFSGGSPTGIVDWEAAAPLELPLHDVLHLLLYTRRLVSGRQLGEILRDQFQRHEWSSEERTLLEQHWPWLLDAPLSSRQMHLLYWLRQVAGHARQQSQSAGYRYRLWERRNVLPVLAAL